MERTSVFVFAMPPKSEGPSLDLELAFWRDGYRLVAGLDEAGRGAWAGPVVAGAVILPALEARPARGWTHSRLLRALAGVDDSKQLTPHEREELFEPIRACALASSTGAASHEEIDSFGIVAASKLAMQRALAGLNLQPAALLLDALVLHEVELPQVGPVRGDALSVSIAAASILAKVTRDRLMIELDNLYPDYRFARNKGYGTPEHIAALGVCGPCPVHRRSYAPIRVLLPESSRVESRPERLP